MTDALPLRPHPDSVRVAREFCSRAVGSAVDEEAGDDAAMIASELVTNAIQAGAGQITLELSLDDRSARVSVFDDAAGEVVLRDPDNLSPSGRGLRIIASLAQQWGVERVSGGKRVWAVLGWAATRDAAGPSDKETA